MEDPNPAYRVGEGVPIPADVPDAREPIVTLTSEAINHRLEMRSMDATIKSLGSGASAARAGALPRIEATGDVLYANPNPRYFPPTAEWHATWSVGAQATWTLGDTLQNASSAREYEADGRAAEAQRIALRAGIAQEVLASYLDVTRSRVAFEKQRVALASAEEAYRVTTDLFRAGRATGTDLIASETDLLNAQLGDVNARIDLTIAAITLRHATGRDIPADLAKSSN
jgi:outer membrane protein TolC